MEWRRGDEFVGTGIEVFLESFGAVTHWTDDRSGFEPILGSDRPTSPSNGAVAALRGNTAAANPEIDCQRVAD